MERHVKERLIGAAVLMAAAIILIPEMLSGPDREAATPDARAKTDAPLKTYTIDLQEQAKATAPTVVEEPAPPPEAAPSPEEPASATVDEPAQAIPESSATIASTPAATTRSEATKPSEPRAAATQLTPSAQTPAPTPEPPRPAPSVAPSAGRWAVQLGSFSKEDTAKRLAEAMRKDGRAAFVMPVRSGAATLYRVRIGPMNDRASAEATLSEVKAKSPGAAVVSHP